MMDDFDEMDGSGVENEEAPAAVSEIQQIKKQLMQLDKETLADRLAAYEYIIPKLGGMVRWCVENYYKPIYYRFRIGREGVGLLVGANLVPESFVILAEEKVSKYEGGKSFVKHDLRMIHVPVKELSYYDVILQEGEWEEQEGLF